MTTTLATISVDALATINGGQDSHQESVRKELDRVGAMCAAIRKQQDTFHHLTPSSLVDELATTCDANLKRVTDQMRGRSL
jgi:hypothetical protein